MKTARPLESDRRHAWKAIILFCAIGLALGGCDASDSSPEREHQPEEEQTANPSVGSTGSTESGSYLTIHEMELSDRARLLEGRDLEALRVTGDTVEVPASAESRLHEFGKGDVLAADVEGGFTRLIEGVTRESGKTVYEVRRARVGETFERLHFVVTSAPKVRVVDSAGEARARQNLPPITKTLRFERDFAQEEAIQLAGNDVTIAAEGRLEMVPGFKFEVKLEGDNALETVGNFIEGDRTLKSVEGKVFTTLETLEANFRVGVNEGQSFTEVEPQTHDLNLPLCSGPVGPFECRDGRPVFESPLPFMGPIKVEPYVRVAYTWAGGGGGYFKGGFAVNGYVMGGIRYDRATDDFTLLDEFDASSEETEWEYGGELDIESRARLEIGARVTLDDERLFEAVPLRATFSGKARINPPLCSLTGRFDVEGTVRYGSFLGSGRHRLYEETPFNAIADLSSIDGCTTDNTEGRTTCVSDSECGGEQQCRGNFCIEKTPMEVVLNWSGDSNLNLYVENPDGELLELSTGPDEQPSEAGWMAIRANGAAVSSGPSHSEIALFERVRPQSMYRIWVEHTGEGDVASFELTVRRNNTPAQPVSMNGELKPGAKSVTYVYSSGEVPGQFD